MMDPFFPGDWDDGARTGNQHATIEDVRKDALIEVLADNLNMMLNCQFHDFLRSVNPGASVPVLALARGRNP